MIRFILRLFGIKDFEPCSSCENLKEQLRFERDEKKRLTDTLIQIVSPKTIEAPSIEINQVAASSALFSRRRAALEAKDREEARILKNSTNIGKPDDSLKSIEKLENELGLTSERME